MDFSLGSMASRIPRSFFPSLPSCPSRVPSRVFHSVDFGSLPYRNKGHDPSSILVVNKLPSVSTERLVGNQFRRERSSLIRDDDRESSMPIQVSVYKMIRDKPCPSNDRRVSIGFTYDRYLLNVHYIRQLRVESRWENDNALELASMRST